MSMADDCWALIMATVLLSFARLRPATARDRRRCPTVGGGPKGPQSVVRPGAELSMPDSGGQEPRADDQNWCLMAGPLQFADGREQAGLV